MATLLVLEMGVFVGDEDAQLVAGDVAASPEFVQSSRGWWAFDDTAEEAITSKELIMPSQYTGSGLAAIVHGFFKTEIVATDEARIDVAVEAKTPDTDTLDMEVAESFDSVNAADVVPGGTAGDPVSKSITLTNADSIAAGDLFRLGIRRDTDHANDTATGDFCITAIEIKDGG